MIVNSQLKTLMFGIIKGMIKLGSPYVDGERMTLSVGVRPDYKSRTV